MPVNMLDRQKSVMILLYQRQMTMKEREFSEEPQSNKTIKIVIFFSNVRLYSINGSQQNPI